MCTLYKIIDQPNCLSRVLSHREIYQLGCELSGNWQDTPTTLFLIVNIMRDKGWQFPGTSLRPITSELKKFDKHIQTVQMPITTFLQIWQNLADVRIIDFLQSQQWRTMDKEDRLGVLINKMLSCALPLSTMHMPTIYSTFPLSMKNPVARPQGIKFTEAVVVLPLVFDPVS